MQNGQLASETSPQPVDCLIKFNFGDLLDSILVVSYFLAHVIQLFHLLVESVSLVNQSSTDQFIQI